MRKLRFAKFLEDIGFSDLSRAQEYQRFVPRILLPFHQCSIYFSLHIRLNLVRAAKLLIINGIEKDFTFL